MGGSEQQSDNMDVDSVGTGGATTPSQRPDDTMSGTGSSGTKRHRRGKNQQSLTSVSALPVPPGPPPPLNPPTGDTTQTTHRSGSINSGTGPAVAPPPPPPTLRGLPNTPAPPPGAAKKGAVGDPQSTPLPPSPAPTPASKSGTTYLTAAQEKAQLAQATNSQGVPPGALNSTQPSGSNVTHVVQAPKKTLGEDPFGDEEGSLVPPPSYEHGTAGGQMPQAMYQTNLASPGPGSFYVQTQSGFVPIQNPPPGIPLFLWGADGNFHQLPPPSAIVSYPPIPTSVLTPVSAMAQGLISSPAPDPATAALHALVKPDPRGSPPNSLSSPTHARADDEGSFDYFSKDATGYPARPGRPASGSYENRGGQQKMATRHGTYPLPGHGGDPLDANHDDDLKSSAALARNFVSRSKDFTSRLDEDEDDDSNFLVPDKGLARRQEQDRYDEDEDDDPYADLPEHPPGRFPEHPSSHLPDFPPNSSLPDRPGGRRQLPPKPSKNRPLLFYEENEKYYEFTNFAPYPVNFRGKMYPTSEHLFQARKFLDHRPLLAEHIRKGSERPRFAFIEARRFAPETRADWKEKSIEIMEEILELKFTQHEKLYRMLLDTGERHLIENAGKYDDFWGNGADGKGRNELGKALMRLRETLREREMEAREQARAAREAAAAAASARGKGKGPRR